MSDETQEQPQDRLNENSQDLKNEIKNEIKNDLKEEFNNFRQKRKHRVIYSICVFALGLVIGYGGGMASHREHHHFHGHDYSNGHVQNWHDIRE